MNFFKIKNEHYINLDNVKDIVFTGVTTEFGLEKVCIRFLGEEDEKEKEEYYLEKEIITSLMNRLK